MKITAIVFTTLILCVGVLMAYKVENKPRHFLIGYAGPTEGIKVNSITHEYTMCGGYDTTMNSYPNLKEFRLFLCKRYGLKGVYITGITEFRNESDANEFYR